MGNVQPRVGKFSIDGVSHDFELRNGLLFVDGESYDYDIFEQQNRVILRFGKEIIITLKTPMVWDEFTISDARTGDVLFLFSEPPTTTNEDSCCLKFVVSATAVCIICTVAFGIVVAALASCKEPRTSSDDGDRCFASWYNNVIIISGASFFRFSLLFGTSDISLALLSLRSFCFFSSVLLLCRYLAIAFGLYIVLPCGVCSLGFAGCATIMCCKKKRSPKLSGAQCSPAPLHEQNTPL